ncbi:uncharacterized protein LOC132278157 [Cornus florida]|uniref:uncharacterized protein LOC132278157 n=1 Tax=Cornus florida TaxID=4283 RepID=UPI00289A6563|nr:uncharacterized protein LOC132278157 [Cornus florida]
MASMINIIFITTTAPYLFLCFLSLLTTQISSQPPHYCSNKNTYTPNSTYRANLNNLLSVLSSKANRVPQNGFFNYTTGDDKDPNNMVYGMFMCRGDVTTDECQECVAIASKGILDACPNQKKAIAWYEKCFIRFSDNAALLTEWNTSVSITLWNPQNVTNEPARFRQLLRDTMNELVTQAADFTDGSGNKFATKEANFTAFQKVYALVQCTPDLSADGCDTCLQDGIPLLLDCCDGMHKQGVTILFPSCNIRYQFYPFYTMVASAPAPPPPPPKSNSTSATKGKGEISSQVIITIVVSVVVALVLFSTGFLCIKKKARERCNAIQEELTVGKDLITTQSLQYDLRTIEAATNNFCNDNKIGEGGFGAVYKGTLPNGQDIAVKRLSKSSSQGEEEFKNEVILVAKLQHRNLVRLVGFCLKSQEKLLIYEFVPNKSLDYFLFDSEKGKQLDWSRRYKIIGGIARGILYLHEDSQLKVIHRDLKASNVLLDGDMNPKVSDFGMARIFCSDQTEGSTSRIVGTFGYMSPEYAMQGQFSVKSDVFSFGVSILEIISGKKNSSFYQSYGPGGLLSYAWKHWRDGTPLEIMDPILRDSYSMDEIIRCIYIGLLCVQEDMDARPSMPSVVQMLNSSLDTLPLPQQPPFSVRGRTNQLKSANRTELFSLNEVSINLYANLTSHYFTIIGITSILVVNCCSICFTLKADRRQFFCSPLTKHFNARRWLVLQVLCLTPVITIPCCLSFCMVVLVRQSCQSASFCLLFILSRIGTSVLFLAVCTFFLFSIVPLCWGKGKELCTCTDKGILLTTQISSQPPHYCSNKNTYTPNSTYRANLNNLLSVLSSKANRVPQNGFFNYTTGDDKDPNNMVYGMFMCRGDVTTDECQECVAIASKGILDACPNQKKAIAWYEKCFIRFSDNAALLTEWNTSVSITLWNPQNVTNEPARFRQLLRDTMNELVTQAADFTDGSGNKFATKEANFTAFQKVYALVQCTPDLSADGCDTCLQDGIPLLLDCCDGMHKQGVTILFPSCNIRYQFYPFYTMVASAPAPPPPPPKSNSTSATKGKGEISSQVIITIVVSVVVALVLFSTGFLCIKKKARERCNAIQEELTVGKDLITTQSLQYDLRTIEAATNNFCNDNKIGEGGFGAVYKGTLPNGQDIAVKRLSKSSSQGEEEFKNEVILVAKLQHRNLVRLVGFCLKSQEKLLIYEFVPNKSLDYFLFDSEKGKQLDWSRRYKIIGGIARGILYLHEDSQLKVIHRDLKASNVLLDGDMNPKVSDFGMARIFCSDQTEGSTSRIVGTFGYMSPEYAMQGQFSVKSDVFSFGVSILEIITGKKNSSFYQSYGPGGLLSYAWKHWRDGTPLEIMDPILRDSYSMDEIIRCIYIGLLCVQEDMDARPSMPSVVQMLNSSLDTLPLPQQPPFSVRGRTNQLKSANRTELFSLNEVSISELNPR